MMFEITPTVLQELDRDWGKDENYASFLLQGEKRGAREDTRAQKSHTKKTLFFSCHE